MLLQYTSQIMVCMGLVRLLASGLEALIFARWHLKETGKKMAIYYWMIFHTIAAWLGVLIIYKFLPGQTFSMGLSLITFAVLIYALMFIIPPYRSKMGLGYQLLGEIEEKKPQQSTQRLIELMQMRVNASYGGVGAIIAFLVFRHFVNVSDIFVVFVTWLNTSVNFLYWAIAGITAVMCCISAFFAVQILYASNKQRAARRRMQAKLGRRLTDEEFVYLFADEQKKRNL